MHKDVSETDISILENNTKLFLFCTSSINQIKYVNAWCNGAPKFVTLHYLPNLSANAIDLIFVRRLIFSHEILNLTSIL